MLLGQPNAFAVEFGTEQKSPWRQSTGLDQQVQQRAVGWHHVFARFGHFAFDANAFVLALHRQSHGEGVEGTQHIATAQRLAAGSGQVDLGHPGAVALVQSLDGQPAGVGHCRKAAGHAQRVVDGLAGLELEDRRAVDAANHRHLRADRADMDHVLGLHHSVGLAVALEQQIVEVEGGDQVFASAQLHRAKAARRRRATGTHQGLGQCRQAADHLHARALDEAGDIDPQPAQLAQRHAEMEVLEHQRDAAADDVGQFCVLHTRDHDRPDPRHVDAPGPVDHQPQVRVDRSPERQHQLIAGLQQVVGGYVRAVIGGGQRGEGPGQQFSAETPDFQGFPVWLRCGLQSGLALDIDLEFAWSVRRCGWGFAVELAGPIKSLGLASLAILRPGYAGLGRLPQPDRSAWCGCGIGLSGRLCLRGMAAHQQCQGQRRRRQSAQKSGQAAGRGLLESQVHGSRLSVAPPP